MNAETRNWIAFVLIAGLILLGYQVFVGGPQTKQLEAEQAKVQASQATQSLAAQAAGPAHLSMAAALAQSPRITIDTPALRGTMSLKGARIDSLLLKGYHVDVAKTSPLVELLSPEGAEDAYFTSEGWVGANLAGLPNDDTLWTAATSGPLTPTHPVVLTYAAPGGLTFTRRITVDDKAMFTLTDTVANGGTGAVTLAPYASVKRIGLPAGLGRNSIVHEGAMGVLNQNTLIQPSYKAWQKKPEPSLPSTGGWIGITDKYWMTAFIPPQNEHIDASLRFQAGASGADQDIYEAAYLGSPRAIAPGAQAIEISHLFAGAKVVPVLNAYKASLGAPRFDDAVDWGWVWFLTKPIFTLLDIFYQKVGNFGVAILMLTVVIRLITFPLANRGFEMGVKMKKIQPELQAMQKKYKDDPSAQQKEMMALYAREKVNPVTGCLPLLFQVPVFYSLTKLFTVTIEMRHAPFFGWIHDLSAPDPTTIMNLFGLIPWDPSTAPLIGAVLGGVLHLGVWPIAYGLAIWLSTAMTPMQGVDPTQQMLMKFMPLIFTFIMAQYAVGLLIYWTWSSLITILQQYVLMRRFKVANPIDDFFSRFAAKPETG
jgi:YidC/Oxa1 family membrane protein insertase